MDLGSFVFVVLLLQAADERGAKGEGRTPGHRSRRGACKDHRPPPPPEECGAQGATAFPTTRGPMGEGPTERGLKGRGGSRPGVPPPFRSMRATDGSRRQGREYDRWVSIFLSSWDAATSCSTELMGYIFATFNKLTCCIIIHVYIYLCLSQKSWVFHGIQGHTLVPPMCACVAGC